MVDEKDVRRVAAESGLDVRTVRRCLVDGEQPRSVVTVAAIHAACIKLGVGWKPKRGTYSTKGVT